MQVAFESAAEDADVGGARVDRVFGELADCLQRVGLRLSDDVDRVPLVADPQRAGGDEG